MKKDIIAFILLLALIGAGLFNTWHLDGFISELVEKVDGSQEHLEKGDFENAESMLLAALEQWNGAEGYTRIFIRHSEIDSTMESFYEVLGDIVSQDRESSVGSYGKLRTRLSTIASMEYVNLGSIF